MTDSQRPITSKARGICKYYTTQRGCFNSKSCKFLHSTEPATDPSGSRPPLLTPYDQAKRCKYYAQGYCKRGDRCWFVHEKDVAGVTLEDEDDDCCSICFERPSLYGLLGGCNHVFCIDCIRKWRDPSGRSSDSLNIKKCPMCRVKCRYIIPSSRFVKDGPEKEQTIQNYKNSMARVPCKHFVATKAKNPKKPMCPYGADCFYQHLNEDGTTYTFPYGADVGLRNWANHNRSHDRPFFALAMDTLFGVDDDLAGSIDVAMDMFGRMLAQAMESSVEGRGPGGRVPEGSRPRRRFPEGPPEHARAEFMSALRAAQAEMSAVTNNIPEERASSPDWDSPEDGAGSGWTWDEVAIAGQSADMELMERLDFLTENMLGSIRVVGRDTESPVPPLEPIGISRPETPLPPLEPIDAGDAPQDDDDMPSLQSVSNSSDSEDFEEGSDDEMEHATNSSSPDDLPPLERIPQSDEEEEANSSFSRRFSTVVERAGNSETMEESTQQAEVSQEPTVLTHGELTPRESEPSVSTQDVATLETRRPELALEPPFVTDGRGRVVWSNKDSTETMVPSESREESREEVQDAPSSAARLFGWMSGFF